MAGEGFWNTISGGGGGAPDTLFVRDEKAQNTAGGTFTSGAWQTRALNTVHHNGITGASLASSTITLPAGTYEVDARAPAYSVDRHQARLFDVTGTAVLVVGATMFTGGSADVAMNDSVVRGRFTLGAQSDVRLEHRCNVTKTTNGAGVEANFGTEVYAEVFIRKIS